MLFYVPSTQSLTSTVTLYIVLFSHAMCIKNALILFNSISLFFFVIFTHANHGFPLPAEISTNWINVSDVILDHFVLNLHWLLP